eukprot:353562-Chlamydomonas_euryale.AAC.4
MSHFTRNPPPLQQPARHLQVPAKVARVQARDRQPVAVPRQHGRPCSVGGAVVLAARQLHRVPRGRVEVCPDSRQARAWDAAALV